MTDQPQFTARLRSGEFTRSTSAANLFSSLQQLLPVDKIYMVLPHPDGKGYELLEAGTLTVDFQPAVTVPQSVEHQPLSELPATPPLKPVEAPLGIAYGLVVPTPASTEIYPFTSDVEPPRAQEVIAAEKGVDQPKPKKVSSKPPVSHIGKQAKSGKRIVKSVGKRATTSIKPDTSDQCSDDPNDTSWLKGLPKAVRTTRPGAVSVTNIRQATLAEQEAASHFGKGF